MVLGIKTATVIAITYLFLSYGGGYIEKQEENLNAVGVSDAAIGLIRGGFEEVGAALGAAAVFFGIAIPSVNARRGEPPAS